MSTQHLRGAVLGSPIAHSLSPLLHRTAFKALGISGDYSAIEVKSGDLQDFLEQRGDEFDYLSLTMPLKEEVLDLQSSNKIDVKVDQLGKRITDCP